MVIKAKRRTEFLIRFKNSGEVFHQVKGFRYLEDVLSDKLSSNVSAAAQLTEAKCLDNVCMQRIQRLRPQCPLKVSELKFVATSINDTSCKTAGLNSATNLLQSTLSKTVFRSGGKRPDDAIYQLSGYFPHRFRQGKKRLHFLVKNL